MLPSEAISITGVLFQPNAPPERGEERLESWDPSLEVLPGPLPRPLACGPSLVTECLVDWTEGATPKLVVRELSAALNGW